MFSVFSTLANIIFIEKDPELAVECLEINTSLITLDWYMLLLVLELFYLSICTSLPLLVWELSTMPTSVNVYIVELL